MSCSLCVCECLCDGRGGGGPPPPAWLVLSCGVQGQAGQLLPQLVACVARLAWTAIGASGIEIEDLHFVVILLT